MQPDTKTCTMQYIERFLRLWSLEITVSNWSCSLFETFFFSSVKNMTRTNWDRILQLCVNIFETDSWPLDINLGWKQFSLGKLFVCAKQSTLIGDTSIVNDFALCSRLDFRCRPDSLQRKLVYGWYRLVCFICGGFCYQISGKRDSAVCWTSSFKVYTVKKKLQLRFRFPYWMFHTEPILDSFKWLFWDYLWVIACQLL